MEATRNLTQGLCRCGDPVPPGWGYWVKDLRRLLCESCFVAESAERAKRPVSGYGLPVQISNRYETGDTLQARLLWAPRQRLVIVRTLNVATKAVEEFRTACKWAGCDYDGVRGNHCTLEFVPSLVRELERRQFNVEIVPEISAELERLAAKARAVETAVALRVERLSKQAHERHGKKIRSYQKVGPRFLASRPSAMLLDDTGLGKSCQILCAMEPGARGLIVAPANMKGAYVGRGKNRRPMGGWADEVKKWLGDHVKVTILSGRDSFRWPEENEVVITGYEILPRAPGETGKNLPPHLPPIPPGAKIRLAADEAQYLANDGTKRHKRFRNVAFRVLESGGSAWGVTATPLNNEPLDLWHVLECFGLARKTFGSIDRYQALHDCTAKRIGFSDQWVLEWGTPRDEVSELLKTNALRRRKRDVLAELPPITFKTLTIELDKKTLALCDRAMAEIDKAGGLDLDEALEVVDKSRSSKIDFKKISQALEALGRAKAPAVLEYLIEHEGREPVVLFATHVAMLETLAARKGWGTITGTKATANLDGKPKTMKRVQVIDLFQSGKLEHGIAATIQCMGTGSTLTRASHAIFHSRLFSHTKNMQAIGRIERLGQVNAMVVTNFLGNHPLDTRQVEILEAKAGLYAASIDAASVSKADMDKHESSANAYEAASRKVAPDLSLRPRIGR